MESKIKTSRKVVLGGKNKIKEVVVGADSPVSVQTMWKKGIVGIAENEEALLDVAREVGTLEQLGCDIIRFAVPDFESAASLSALQKRIDIPLIADIHFDYRLAIACVEGGVAGVRINPGNIGSKDRVKKVVESCKERGAAVRIGVNSGSLPRDLEDEVVRKVKPRSEAMALAALREVEYFDELNFSQVVVSLKSSDVEETISANECFAKKSDVPLHLGVTEAGPLVQGIVKSTLAFSALLKEGIGGTIRVSLSSPCENEVLAGVCILKECGKRKAGVNLVSCPRCGRIGFDVHSFVKRWQARLYSMGKQLTVAVMGCPVNGPGEARHADIGIAGNESKVIIFCKGKIIRTAAAKDADRVFEEEIEKL